MGFFVPGHSIENLRHYKYQSEDRSIITKIFLKPFWNTFVQVFPKWMAPNLVTLSGLGFILINLIVTLYYDPQLKSEMPRWVYLFNAIGLFLYQTFDGCDGVHARRTGQSGPLGELFDHSIDAINTTLSAYIFCSAIGTGYGYKMIYSQFAVLTNFYLSTWEEYHTHVLFLSEISGPVEGILAICLAYLATAIFGPDIIWRTTLTTFKINGQQYIFKTTDFLLVTFTLGLILNCYFARRNVTDHYRKEKSSSNMDIAIKEAMKGLLPYILYVISVIIIVTVEKRFIGFSFVLSIGSTVAFFVGRIIVSHLTKQSYPMFNISMFIPLSQLISYLIAINFTAEHSTDSIIEALSWLGCGLSLGIYALFLNEIIYEFTNYLDVYALTIKHPKFI
ncbi:similar to Saccharomyces cerevisiae YHR123W EPT1 sn-1,2-diacylglycerol ethanolamine-and cholinephosphotranferase [Maudiozyma saulgeensis]|uniref:diacylglycerol cholinephosphotransferase n=1 Tax=Maudiozyma saulgeensis TaxID=1789683 RepID=A0A1X7QZT5_9SACH|nr:similar to Saccharomyces cerevisiae YHR123W EPT1 sn-1,2-diacylglycerol ethanolamine-and cholinephosphotranferase [Kazachstania saulgeensis]